MVSRAELYEDDCCDEEIQRLARKRYRGQLMRHPDCRDPDHPGCSSCLPEDEDMEDEEDDSRY